MEYVQSTAPTLKHAAAFPVPQLVEFLRLEDVDGVMPTTEAMGIVKHADDFRDLLIPKTIDKHEHDLGIIEAALTCVVGLYQRLGLEVRAVHVQTGAVAKSTL